MQDNPQIYQWQHDLARELEAPKRANTIVAFYEARAVWRSLQFLQPQDRAYFWRCYQLNPMLYMAIIGTEPWKDPWGALRDYHFRSADIDCMIVIVPNKVIRQVQKQALIDNGLE